MKKQTTPLLLLALYGLLICAMLVLAAAGVRCYTAVVETRSAHTRQRSAMAYLQTQASACGGQNAVQLREGPQGVAVCLRDPDTDYETRVYCYIPSICAPSCPWTRRRPTACARCRAFLPSGRARSCCG